MSRFVLVFVAALGAAMLVAGQVSDVWARAQSGGSRGSRSYSAPARPSTPVTPTTPTSPSRSLGQPPSPTAAQRPGFLGRFGGALGGFLLGGLLGGLLFGGFGHGFGGIGLMDILLVVGGVMVLMYVLRRRREAPEPAYATGVEPDSRPYAGATSGAAYSVAEPAPVSAQRADVELGVAHIRSMDPGFDPTAFADSTRAYFGTVQSAVSMRDVGIVRDRLTAEMYGVLLTQCEELKAARRRSYVEKIDITRAEVTEAWQERGQDYATVYLDGTMFDYVVDESTGQVVDGSRTTPVGIDEFWTFTRPVGPNPWKLTAIQRAA